MTSTQDSATTRQRSAVLFLIAASALFGLDTTISAYVLRQVRPADLFLVETSVGTVILWVYLLASGRHRRPARLRPHIVLGLIEPGFAYLLFNVGLHRTSAVAGGILISTETIMGVALGVVILHERLSGRAIVALVTGVAGTVLVSIGSGGHTHGEMVGNLLVLLAAAGGGFYLVVARRIPASDDVLTGTAYQVLAGCGVAVAFAAVSWPGGGSGLASAGGLTVILTLATGVLVAVPFLLLNRSLEVLAASTASLLLNLIPVFAVVTAVVLLGEPLSLATVGGGACILAGLTVLGLGDQRVARRSRMRVRRAEADDLKPLLAVWERAVRATHHFLEDADVVALRPLVAEELAGNAVDWWVLASPTGAQIGFLGMSDNTVEALFIDPDYHRQGGGTLLLEHAQRMSTGPLAVDVNEENQEALRFYEALGFAVMSRSSRDAGDRPFPILHMRRPAHPPGTGPTGHQVSRESATDARR